MVQKYHGTKCDAYHGTKTYLIVTDMAQNTVCLSVSPWRTGASDHDTVTFQDMFNIDDTLFGVANRIFSSFMPSSRATITNIIFYDGHGNRLPQPTLVGDLGIQNVFYEFIHGDDALDFLLDAINSDNAAVERATTPPAILMNPVPSSPGGTTAVIPAQLAAIGWSQTMWDHANTNNQTRRICKQLTSARNEEQKQKFLQTAATQIREEISKGGRFSPTTKRTNSDEV